MNKISIKLNQLNYLIGKENLKESVGKLFDENPEISKYWIF
jgi:type II restriction enzyme